MIRRLWLPACIGILAIVVAVPPAAPELVPAGPASIVAPVALGNDAMACDTDCSQNCEGGLHYAVGVEEEDANASRNDGWHNWPDCRTGLCQYSHGGCIIEFAGGPFKNLVESLRVNDVEGIRAVLAAEDDLVTLNVARSAIQIEECGGSGRIWAHLPVEATLLEALVADE